MLVADRRRGAPGAALRRAARAAWREPRWSWVPPVAVAAVVAAAYLALDARASDLPAHVFRAELFGREGFAIWSNGWYGGHHLPAYSVLYPPLAWLLGPRVAAALACVAAAALFERIVRRRYGERARWGALWFGVGVGSLLFAERLPFAVGVALGLGAVLALARRRRLGAAGLAVASSLASPVAGLFVALAGAAYGLSSPVARGRAGAGVAAGALIPALALNLAFPEGGWLPFEPSAYIGVPLLAAILLVFLPPEERTLRIGALLYLAGTTAALLVDTAVGGNVTRLGSLMGGPVLAAAVAGRVGDRGRAAILAVAFLALAYWQWAPAVRATVDAIGDPSTEAAYYEPLLDRLERRPPPGRIEIPFLRSHFEAAHVAERFPLARGWQRQLDAGRNELFYEGELGRREYARWLHGNAVSHVAVADAPVDYSAEAERRLVESEPGFLEPVWRSEHWRLFEVRRPEPLVEPEPGAGVTLAALDDTAFTLRFREPGAVVVRVRWSPYWLAEDACVEPAGRWTRVISDEPGSVTVSSVYDVGRIQSRSRRCG